MTTYPLSPAQLAIWFEDLAREGPHNTGFFCVTLRGDLAENLVAVACEAIVHRHRPLRTVVRGAADHPVLELRPAKEILRYGTAEVPCAPRGETAATHDYRAVYGKLHYDLTREAGPTFTLLRHGPGRRTLLVEPHHLWYDGRSKFVFAREFVAALTALRAGRSLPDDPLPWPEWPAGGGDTAERVAEFWATEQIESYPPLRLPRADPPVAVSDVGTLGRRSFDGDVRDRLVYLASANGTSMFGGLLATMAVTLYGFGNGRMVVAVPVDVSTPETRNLIGLAVNVVPVALRVDGADTFVSVLAKAAAARERLKDFRLVPFRFLGPGKAWSAHSRALYSRISLSYQRMATDVPEIPGLDSSWDFLAPNTAQTFDLMCHMRDAYDRIAVRLDFSGSELDATAAATIADHFGAALVTVLDRPTTPLRQLDLLPAGRPVARVTGAAVTAPRVAGNAAASLLAERAAEHPDRPAVTGPSGTLSYRELAGATTADPTFGALVRAIHGGQSMAAPPAWQARRLDLPAGGVRTLQLAPPGSAAFWQECWLTWAAGGTLVTSGGTGAPDAVRQHGITLVVAPYHLLRRLAAAGTALRDVLTPMPDLRPSAEVVALMAAGVRVHAQYVHDGAGVVAMQTCTLAGLGDPPVLQYVADGVRISVTGPDGQPLPRGVTGRLVVGTADTGDLAEVDRHGTVRYLGPAADTVEWAGRSMHLPSVERHLAAHPGVEEAVVVPVDRQPVAYLVPRPGTGFDLRQARLHLRLRSVPGELRLARVQVVPALPLAADGTVDRTALAGGQWPT